MRPRPADRYKGLDHLQICAACQAAQRDNGRPKALRRLRGPVLGEGPRRSEHFTDWHSTKIWRSRPVFRMMTRLPGIDSVGTQTAIVLRVFQVRVDEFVRRVWMRIAGIFGREGK